MEENGEKHHTDDYEGDNLVVRRGTPFLLSIKHEGFDQDQDEFYVTIKTGKKPKQRDGSYVDIRKGEISKVYKGIQKNILINSLCSLT